MFASAHRSRPTGWLEVSTPSRRRSGAVVVPLVAAGADLLGRLQVDQRLQHELHGFTHDVEVSAGAERVEEFGKGRLVEGDRGLLLV